MSRISQEEIIKVAQLFSTGKFGIFNKNRSEKRAGALLEAFAKKVHSPRDQNTGKFSLNILKKKLVRNIAGVSSDKEETYSEEENDTQQAESAS